MCIFNRASMFYQELISNKEALIRRMKYHQQWSPLAEGKYKMNCDATVTEDGKIGLGMAVCNHRGEFMLTIASGFTGKAEVFLVEAWAIRSGFITSKEVGLWPLEVESDRLSVVNLIKAGKKAENEIGLLSRY